SQAASNGYRSSVHSLPPDTTSCAWEAGSRGAPPVSCRCGLPPRAAAPPVGSRDTASLQTRRSQPVLPLEALGRSTLRPGQLTAKQNTTVKRESAAFSYEFGCGPCAAFRLPSWYPKRAPRTRNCRQSGRVQLGSPGTQKHCLPERSCHFAREMTTQSKDLHFAGITPCEENFFAFSAAVLCVLRVRIVAKAR